MLNSKIAELAIYPEAFNSFLNVGLYSEVEGPIMQAATILLIKVQSSF